LKLQGTLLQQKARSTLRKLKVMHERTRPGEQNARHASGVERGNPPLPEHRNGETARRCPLRSPLPEHRNGETARRCPLRSPLPEHRNGETARRCPLRSPLPFEAKRKAPESAEGGNPRSSGHRNGETMRRRPPRSPLPREILMIYFIVTEQRRLLHQNRKTH